MKSILIFIVAVVSIVSAFPVDEDKARPEVVKSNYVNNGDKGYNFE